MLCLCDYVKDMGQTNIAGDVKGIKSYGGDHCPVILFPMNHIPSPQLYFVEGLFFISPYNS